MKIKKMRMFSVVAVCVSIILSTGSLTAEQPGYSLDGLPPVHSFTLPNGMKILSIEDELPVTEIICSIGFGRLHEVKENAGISELIVKEISLSGTAEYPGNELYRILEDAGGSISINAGWENITIIIRVLSRHSELAFDIIADILSNPVFSKENIEYSKSLVLQDLKREMDDPASAGFAKLRGIIFNKTGYGTLITDKSVRSISSSDLHSTWKRAVKGGNINVAVSSGIGKKKIIELASEKLSGVESGSRLYYSIDNESLKEQLKHKAGNIYLLPRELKQATIVTGTVAPGVNYSGNYSLFLMNYILGGGSFNSRLMTEIRVKRGLAYSVFSLVRNRYSTGVFLSFVQTRNEEASTAMILMKENIIKMAESEVGNGELEWARGAVINSYVFNFATSKDILSRYLDIEFNQLDSNYYRDYLNNISRVTPSDIKKESALLLNKGLVTVVVGDRSLEDTLKKYGNVVFLDE